MLALFYVTNAGVQLEGNTLDDQGRILLTGKM